MTELDWDNPPMDKEKFNEFVEEARRQGCGYKVIVEGYDHPADPEGTWFIAKDDKMATEFAYSLARLSSQEADRSNWLQYPTHPYKLYHRDSGRLIDDYTPPTPDEIATLH